MIKVIIVEDQPVHQEYLSSIINNEEILELLGVLADGNEALLKIPFFNPDIVLIDIGLPGVSGIECIKQLKPICPKTKFLVCTVNEDDESIFESLKAGADGYLLKKSNPGHIRNAIHDLIQGGAPINSDIALKIINLLLEKNEPKNKTKFQITARENEILHLLAKGKSYIEVADSCDIAVSTLKKHVHTIYKKLEADNRTEALNKYFGKI